jgi:nitrogenase molybdenum-iron protein NifN
MTNMRPNYISTTNACKLCKPLGASLVFKGIEGSVPYLHGSQGCATYMRRYIISHFNEPIDIASSSLGEKHAIYGGGPNLKLGLTNVIKKYRPAMIGIATTCLTETIGDDVEMILDEYNREVNNPEKLPTLVHVQTPSYSGTHMEGFHAAVAAVVEQLAGSKEETDAITLLPGFVSAADLRYLKEVLADFSLETILLPDYSETLDGPARLQYEKIPAGGTALDAISRAGSSSLAVEFGRTLVEEKTGGSVLQEKFNVQRQVLGLPMGINETDRFFDLLSSISGHEVPEKHVLERGRLVDAYVDGHKYVFGKKAVVYGEEDMVVGLTSFLTEIGIRPVLCASGGRSGHMSEAIAEVTGKTLAEQPRVEEGMDFYDIAAIAEEMAPDLLIGHSKGYPLASKLKIPLIRVGFPIHDRIGGQRILHLGYRGAQQLFDTIANALIARKQDMSDVGYSYM